MPCLTDVGDEKRTRANPNLPFQARLRGATGGDLIVGRVKAVTGPQIVVGRCAQRRSAACCSSAPSVISNQHMVSQRSNTLECFGGFSSERSEGGATRKMSELLS